MTAPLPSATQTYKALAHPARLRILAMLREGELCVCQITAVLDLAPSTVSAHLAELRRAGLVAERREGRWVHYRLAESAAAGPVLEMVWRQLAKDEEVGGDSRVLRQLREVPVEDLCRAGLDLARFAISRDT